MIMNSEIDLREKGGKYGKCVERSEEAKVLKENGAWLERTARERRMRALGWLVEWKDINLANSESLFSASKQLEFSS